MSWHITGRDGSLVKIRKRRSVKEDYKYFDPPRIVWNKINSKRWIYKVRSEMYEQRDLAFMCFLYLSTGRVSEIARFKKWDQRLPSVTKGQFEPIGDFLMVRNLRVIKRRYIKVGKTWKVLDNLEEYPKRREIQLPLKGGLNLFTNPVVGYLNLLKPAEELFKFGRTRGYQIVNYCTNGEFPHYLREMGLKMWLRVYGKDLSQLKDFSGHKKVENLMDYLKEIRDEEATRRILSIKLEDFEPKVV